MQVFRRAGVQTCRHAGVLHLRFIDFLLDSPGHIEVRDELLPLRDFWGPKTEVPGRLEGAPGGTVLRSRHLPALKDHHDPP